jgi:hypothetical protein
MDMPMTRLTARSFALLSFTLAGAAVFADELRDRLSACNDLADADARLACYDAAVDRSRQSADSGAAPTPAQPAARVQAEPASAAEATGGAASLSQEDFFGKSGEEVERTVQEATGSEPIDSLGATVTKLQRYSYDKVLITLDNGQVWKQVDSSSLRLRVGDTVEIERASLGSFMLKKQGSKRSMRVSRED